MRLARLSALDTLAEPPGGAVQLLVRGTTIGLSLAGVVDVAAERARLRKEVDKARGEAQKLEGKLANADFVARAPEEVVAENRERLDDLHARASKYELALARLADL